MKFTHAADAHLDSFFKGLKNTNEQLREKLESATFDAFSSMISQSIAADVDFVILAGDQYDNPNRSLKAQNFLKKQFELLKENNIEVFMIYGNHDYLSNESTYIDFPDNVHIFGEEVETKLITTKSHETVAVSGFSYNQRNIGKGYVQDFPERKSNVDYHIGIYHGMEASQSDSYAPFTVSEMKSKNYDYWAMGHIHKRQNISENPYIVYPGSLQGLNRNETGIKGFYLVEAQGHNLIPEFKATSRIVWDSVDVNLSGGQSLQNIKDLVRDSLEKIGIPTLVTINLNNVNKIDDNVTRYLVDGELQNDLIEESVGRNYYPYKINLNYADEITYQSIDKDYWDKAADEIFTEKNILKNIDKKLLNNSVIKNYLSVDISVEEIKMNTKNILNREVSGDSEA